MQGAFIMAKWIQNAIKHKGALRKQLKAKKGKPLPAKKVNAKLKALAKKKKKTKAQLTLQRRLVLAKTLRKLAAKRKKKK